MPTEPYATYISYDLPADFLSGNPPARKLCADLVALLLTVDGVRLLEGAEQIDTLAECPIRRPFDTALALGSAGMALATQLHSKTGWFPRLLEIGVTRRETAERTYELVSTSGETLDRQLAAVPAGRVAIIDDTIYQGTTLLGVLHRLPHADQSLLSIFCQQAMAETVDSLQAIGTVYAATSMRGTIEREVTIIKLSGLFTKGAIRSAKGEWALYERREWLQRWFGQDWREVEGLSRRLCALVEQDVADFLGGTGQKGRRVGFKFPFLGKPVLDPY